MASLQSYATSPVVVTLDDQLGEIRITGGVLEIDGALDAIPDIYHTIRCLSSGGLRSLAGASGTLGGRKQSLTIIEEDNAHTFGTDNGKHDSTGGGTGSRFGPGATNTLIYDNLIWFIEGRGGRSDFDIAQGTNSDGTGGAGVTFRGLHLIQRWDTGNATHFNHMWSRNFKMEVHPELGFGWRITNYTQSHAALIEVQPGDQFAGLVIDDVSFNGNAGGRVVVNPGANQTFTLFNLDTPDITESGSPSSAKTLLVNPVGVPARTNNWNGYTSVMEVQRDIPFNFTGADDATGELLALAQNTHAQAANEKVDIPANGQVSVRVKTNYSDAGAVNGAWASLDGFRFAAYGRGFRKYFSGNTTINVGNTPATRDVALTADVFPNGDAIAARSGTDGVDTASDFYQVVKDYEIAHPDLPSRAESMVTIDSGGNIVLGASMGVRLSTGYTELIDDSSNILQVKTDGGGIAADKGINSIDFGSTTILQAGTKALLKLPITDSTGTSSLLEVTAHANEVVGVFKDDGSKLGHNSYASDGSWSLLIAAGDSAANTRVGLARAGYEGRRATLDLSAGGTFSVSFDALVAIPGTDGTGLLYDSTANSDSLVVVEVVAAAVAAAGGYKAKEAGDCVIKLKPGSSGASDVFKAYHDAVAAADGEGTRVPAFGRKYLDITAISSQPGNLFLGSDCIISRYEAANGGQWLAAVPHGGIEGVAVDGPAAAFISYQLTVGSCNLDLINQSIAEVKARTDSSISQLKLICQSLPRHYYAPWTPGNPAVFFMRGQQRLHDVNKRNWGISNPDGNLLIEPVTGYGDFDGETRVEASLNRGAGDDIVNYAEECTLAYRIKPLDEDGTFILNEMGAMRLRLVMSGGDGTLKVGHSGDNDYTHATIKAGKWNDIVLSIQRNPDNANYPFVRLSATDGGYDGNSSPGVKAVQTWNTSSNDVFGSIASHTGAFYIGATSNGFKGQVSSCYFHPSETALNYVWETGDHKRAVGWDDYHQIWNGLPGDNSEGLSDDIVEDNVIRALARLASILEKLNHADIANAVLTQPFQPGWSASREDEAALGEFIKWLADRLEKASNETEVAAGILGGKARAEGATTTYRDLADGKDVRSITTGSPAGTRTAATTPPEE